MINVLQSSVYAVLIAMGLVFVIPQNEIDLSVGGNYVLTGIVAALFMRGGMTPALAIVLALSVSVLIGSLNALTSQIIGIPSLIGTLAMSWMLRGLELALSNGTQVTGLPLSDPIISVLGGGRLFGFPALAMRGHDEPVRFHSQFLQTPSDPIGHRAEVGGASLTLKAGC